MDQYLAKITQGEKFEARLTAPRDKNTHGITFRSLIIKGMQSIQTTEQQGQKSIHTNFTLAEGFNKLTAFLPLFKRVILVFENETIEWIANRRGEWIQQSLKATQKPLEIAHNRIKQHPLPEGAPVPFLVHLGVMKADGKVFPAKYDKF